MPVQLAIQLGMPRAVFGRPNCPTVYCNANSGSESRIRFQNSRDTTAQILTKGGTESFMLFNNANLSQARRQTAQVTMLLLVFWVAIHVGGRLSPLLIFFVGPNENSLWLQTGLYHSFKPSIALLASADH